MIAASTAGSGLATPAARWILIAYWGGALCESLMTGLAFQNSGVLPAFAIAFLGILLLTAPGQVPLTCLPVSALVACALLALTMVLAGADTAQRYTIIDLASFLVTLLIPRGNRAEGAIGTALFLAILGCWLIARSADVEEAARILTYPALSLMAGAVWMVLLGYVVRRERRALDGLARTEEPLTGGLSARNVDHMAASVSRVATPVLRAIAGGAPIDAGLHREALAVEATVRDGLRAPHLLGSELGASLLRARRNGVQVVLVGEGLSTLKLTDAFVQAVRDVLMRPGLNSVTIRVPASGKPATVLAQHGDGSVFRIESARG